MLLNRASFGATGMLPNGTVPFAFADFKNGIYEINGSSAAFGDVLVADSNWAAFDSANIIDGTGFQDDGSGPGLKLEPTLAATIIPACTVVPSFVTTGDGSEQIQISMINLSAFTPQVEGYYLGNSCAVGDHDDQPAEVSDAPGHVSNTQVAFNLSNTRCALSVNGRSVAAVDVSPTGIFDTIAFYLAGGLTLESIGFYPLQPEADLPSLSDNGLPRNLSVPVITGDLTVGSVLSVSNGTWANSPASYAYQWVGQNGSVDGATGNTYTTTSDDLDGTVSCQVTATNAQGWQWVGDDDVGPITA